MPPRWRLSQLAASHFVGVSMISPLSIWPLVTAMRRGPRTRENAWK
jgi:hypothetical protein